MTCSQRQHEVTGGKALGMQPTDSAMLSRFNATWGGWDAATTLSHTALLLRGARGRQVLQVQQGLSQQQHEHVHSARAVTQDVHSSQVSGNV